MTDAERIAELERAVEARNAQLKAVWRLFADACLCQSPDELTRSRAFYGVDKFMRAEKLLP